MTNTITVLQMSAHGISAYNPWEGRQSRLNDQYHRIVAEEYHRLTRGGGVSGFTMQNGVAMWLTDRPDSGVTIVRHDQR